MKAVTLFILFAILGIVLFMLNDERKKLIKQLEDARELTLNAEIESGRKEFALNLISNEHRQEAAELRSKLEGSKKQNDILKAVIEVERQKRKGAEECRSLKI